MTIRRAFLLRTTVYCAIPFETNLRSSALAVQSRRHVRSPFLASDQIEKEGDRLNVEKRYGKKL